METFNKNWLVILLTAVVFGTLGYLVGKTSAGEKHMRIPHEDHKLMKFKSDDGNEFVFESEDDGEFEVIEKADTVVKDGKKTITVEVKKIKK